MKLISINIFLIYNSKTTTFVFKFVFCKKSKISFSLLPAGLDYRCMNLQSKCSILILLFKFHLQFIQFSKLIFYTLDIPRVYFAFIFWKCLVEYFPFDLFKNFIIDLHFQMNFQLNFVIFRDFFKNFQTVLKQKNSSHSRQNHT
jgi:hypothetical protein